MPDEQYTVIPVKQLSEKDNLVEIKSCGNKISLYLRWSIFFILLIILIVSEAFWRRPLFDKTIEIVPDFQKSANNSTINFFKVISDFGTEAVIIPILALTMIFFHINVSFSMLFVVLYSSYYTNLLKIIYGEERPFWMSQDFIVFSCEGGYGNPSGHSYSSTAIYLSLWYILTRKTKLKEKHIIFSIIIGIILFGLVISILISRVFLGVHSINQVLYGGCLGIFTFALVFILIDFPNMTEEEFAYYFKEIKWIIFFMAKYIIMFFTLLFCYLYIEHDSSKFIDRLNNICPLKGKEYSRFNPNGLNSAIPYLGLVSAHIGLIVLFYVYHNKSNWFGKDICLKELNEYMRIKLPRWFLFLVLFIVLVGLPFILYISIPSTSSLGIIFVFKIGLPYLLIGFSAYFLVPLLTIRWIYRKELIS
jgi:undecaprenyl-diphosphatase